VRERAERLAAATGGEVEETVGRVGGGALPLAELPSFACALEESLAAPLRAGEPPVVGVVRDGRLLLDCLTLTDEEAEEAAGLVAVAREHRRDEHDEDGNPGHGGAAARS
jgi:L-seryl-tRNA(Ser) seleniumtransferase